MKSKFIKDLFTTGFTQILVMLLGIILLRIMAEALSKEYFGIFMVIRRAVGIGTPLITLNLAVGLARYVSYKKENEKEYITASLFSISLISFLVIIISIIFKNKLSFLLFNAPNYSLFVLLTAFFIFSYGTYTISYSFFRGRQEMNRANRMQVLYYLFPVMAGLLLWQLFENQNSMILSLYFFSFSLWGIILGVMFLWQEVDFSRLSLIRMEVKSVKALFFYSLSRIPSGFFLALVFGIPVFVASHKISLVAAGYVGIAVAIIRLMEIFATPFNLLFLPKFAEIKRNNDSTVITDKVSIVISFIFTALPFLAVVSYGLAEYTVIIFFGSKYIPAVQGVSVVILCSFFYVSYVLTRGILDGLFSFPYVNIICLAGFLTTAISSIIFNNSVFMLTLDFGLGLVVMGGTAVVILIKQVNVSASLKDISISFIITTSVFALLVLIDSWSDHLIINSYVRFGVKILYRVILLLSLFWFYWKPNSLWGKELLRRT